MYSEKKNVHVTHGMFMFHYLREPPRQYVFLSSTVDCDLKPWSGQTKYRELDMCCFTANTQHQGERPEHKRVISESG